MCVCVETERYEWLFQTLSLARLVWNRERQETGNEPETLKPVLSRKSRPADPYGALLPATHLAEFSSPAGDGRESCWSCRAGAGRADRSARRAPGPRGTPCSGRNRRCPPPGAPASASPLPPPRPGAAPERNRDRESRAARSPWELGAASSERFKRERSARSYYSSGFRLSPTWSERANRSQCSLWKWACGAGQTDCSSPAHSPSPSPSLSRSSTDSLAQPQLQPQPVPAPAPAPACLSPRLSWQPPASRSLPSTEGPLQKAKKK